MSAAAPATGTRARNWTSWEVQKWLFLALTAIFIAVRCINLTQVCLDGDEIFSVLISSHSWTELVRVAANDAIHPPLFYFLLKIWIRIGNDSLLWVRLLPALLGTLALAPLLLLGRELHLRPIEINAAVALAALNPLLIYHAQHDRMYSLLMLCGLTSLWLFHRIVSAANGPAAGTFAALTVANIALVNTHYYGWLLVVLEVCYLLFWLRPHFWRGVFSAALVFLASIPWLWVAARGAMAKGGVESNLGWIPKPDFNELKWFFRDMAGVIEFPSVAQAAITVMAVLVLVAVWRQWSAGDRAFLHAAGYLSFFALVPAAIAFTAARLLPSSVWGHRHLIFIAVPLLMLVASSVLRLPSRALHAGAVALFLVWACLGTELHIQGDHRQPPYDTLVLQILAQDGKTTPGPVPFFAVVKDLHYPVWFYLEALKAGKTTGFAAPIPNGLAREAANIEVRADASIEEATGRHFWVGYSSDGWTRTQSPESILLHRGCRTGAGMQVSDRYRTVTIFPAWCGQ